MNFIEDFAETIKNIQGFQPDLFAGATETELKAAEEKMNIMLPEDFKNFTERLTVRMNMLMHFLIRSFCAA